jgi:beta-glucosidase-like glycosyl hydrolase
MIMEKHLSALSLREKCAQMILIAFRFDQPDYDQTLHFVKKEGVGGILLEGGSIFDTAPFVNSLQRVAKFPLLVASPLEDGAGEQISGATRFPPNLALGAAGSEDLALQKARHAGLEARALGIRWLLAPVVDLAGSAPGGSPSPRSFGQDPARVTRLARAMLRGFHSVGAMACLKHFPGRAPGATRSAPDPAGADLSAGRWREAEGRPFLELLSEGDAVMTGHFVAPELDPSGPASLSPAVTREKLRRELGFQGLICTERLAKSALEGFATEAQAAERAAAAGADVLLGPSSPQEALEALVGAVQAGRLPEPVIDLAAERVLAAKERLGLFTDRMTDVASIESILGSPAPRAAAERIAQAAVTRVRGEGTVKGPVTILKIAGEGTRGDLTPFLDELGKEVALGEGSPTCVVALMGRFPPAGEAREGASPPAARILEAARVHSRLVQVALGSPASLFLAGGVGDGVCSYGEDEFSQRAAARALSGRIPFGGTLPVEVGA